MSPWSHSVYSPSQVRELDQRAIAHLDISGYELMCRAGQYAFDMGLARFTQARHWLVLCGSGNNAGDGYVIARLARAAGVEVTVVAITDPLRLSGDACKAFEDFRAAGGETQAYDPVSCPAGDLVIDAMLGTGIDRDLEGPYFAAVNGVNLSGKPILAVDMPTGINGLTGEVMGVAVDADVSIEMIQRWFLINGTLSAIGTAIAFGHPITIATAFVAAPFTSLNPAVAAGWVAGLVEAFLRKPQVRDFENLADDITHLRGFWHNNITRILLVVMFANLGSVIGTFAGGFAIASLL